MSSLRHQTDTTPFALPFIGGVVLAVPSKNPVGYPRITLTRRVEAD